MGEPGAEEDHRQHRSLGEDQAAGRGEEAADGEPRERYASTPRRPGALLRLAIRAVRLAVFHRWDLGGIFDHLLTDLLIHLHLFSPHPPTPAWGSEKPQHSCAVSNHF